MSRMHSNFRYAIWTYFFLPRGAWWVRDGKVVLFNGPMRPLLIHCPKEGVYRPDSKLFNRSWKKWDGPNREDIPTEFEKVPYDVVHERRFYDASKSAPWVDAPASAETRIKITLIVCDFMDGKMPERGGK